MQSSREQNHFAAALTGALALWVSAQILVSITTPGRVETRKRELFESDPAKRILNLAHEWNTDCRGRIGHFFVGITVDALIRRASCPVTTGSAEAKTNGVEAGTAAVAAEV